MPAAGLSFGSIEERFFLDQMLGHFQHIVGGLDVVLLGEGESFLQGVAATISPTLLGGAAAAAAVFAGKPLGDVAEGKS